MSIAEFGRRRRAAVVDLPEAGAMPAFLANGPAYNGDAKATQDVEAAIGELARHPSIREAPTTPGVMMNLAFIKYAEHLRKSADEIMAKAELVAGEFRYAAEEMENTGSRLQERHDTFMLGANNAVITAMAVSASVAQEKRMETRVDAKKVLSSAVDTIEKIEPESPLLAKVRELLVEQGTPVAGVAEAKE